MNRSSRDLFNEILFEPLASFTGPAVLGPEICHYPGLLKRVDCLADRLRGAGLEDSMRVGICCDPSPEYIVSLLAVLRSGATALMLSPTWTRFEVDRCIQSVNPSFLLTHGANPGTGGVHSTIDTDEKSLRILDCRRGTLEAGRPGDAVIIFTSGTSGLPKGVVLSAGGLLSNVAAIREYLEVEAKDAAPLFTPTCYAYAVSQVLVQILGRAAICPIRRGLRYPILILEAIQQFGLKGLSANPTSFKILMKTAAGEDLDLTSLRYAMGGGQFLARQVVDDMQQCFPNSGVVNQYGCTENSPRISYHWVRDHEQPLTGKSLPVGRAVRGTELMVADEQANPVSEGEIGQVMIRGTSLMSRYWRMPGETKEKFIKGWLKTGDVGLLDSEQNLVLIGRMTDSINIGNEKVDPGEIEGYIQELPEIQEAAILGVEDPLLGEAVEAVVQVVEQNTLTESEVTLKCRSYLKELVSAYKIPRKIHLRQSLPRNLYGKLDRKRLREWIADPGK